MTYIELRAIFAEAPADWSPVIDLLGRMGCPNTLQEDRPPSITACLVHVEGSEERAREIEAELMKMGASKVIRRLLPDEDWAEVWKKFFHPRRVGEKIIVRPTWEQADHQADDIEIVLDPGQAFGTGDHPTTRLCLELLEGLPLGGKRVADLGCGSGILSIAACKLGASEVAGLDIEPLSVEVAKANGDLNEVSARFVAGNSIQKLGPGPWHVVVSNIISATLIAMAPEIAEVEPENWVVSGIIGANWPDVRAAAEREGFIVKKELEEDGWVAARFEY